MDLNGFSGSVELFIETCFDAVAKIDEGLRGDANVSSDNSAFGVLRVNVLWPKQQKSIRNVFVGDVVDNIFCHSLRCCGKLPVLMDVRVR